MRPPGQANSELDQSLLSEFRLHASRARACAANQWRGGLLYCQFWTHGAVFSPPSRQFDGRRNCAFAPFIQVQKHGSSSLGIPGNLRGLEERLLTRAKQRTLLPVTFCGCFTLPPNGGAPYKSGLCNLSGPRMDSESTSPPSATGAASSDPPNESSPSLKTLVPDRNPSSSTQSKAKYPTTSGPGPSRRRKVPDSVTPTACNNCKKARAKVRCLDL